MCVLHTTFGPAASFTVYLEYVWYLSITLYHSSFCFIAMEELYGHWQEEWIQLYMVMDLNQIDLN